MELKEFVKETLTSIVEGIELANKDHNRFQMSGGYHSSKNVNGEFVEFDVSVIAQDKTDVGGKGKFGIIIASAFVGGSAEARKEETNLNTNRIKFRVFVTED